MPGPKTIPPEPTEDPGTSSAAAKGRVPRETEIGPDGLPRSRAVPDWWALVEDLERRVAAAPSGLGLSAERARGLVLAALRFSRPDGSPMFGPVADSPRGAFLKRLAVVLDEPGLATVARWWFRVRPPGPPAPPPLPAFSSSSRPLAVLRADWRSDGDWIAVDARGPSTALELAAGGGPILGPSWPRAEGPSKVVAWSSGPTADYFEWATGAGPSKVVRLVVLLRGQRLALVAEQRRGADGIVSMCLPIFGGTSARSVPDSRAIALKRGPTGAVFAPLALPTVPYATERGSLSVEDDHLVLSGRSEEGRAFLPLLASWDKARNRRGARWRVLTVTERGRESPPGVAFAGRIGWGPGDGLVVYRSLGRAVQRAFLGHQTSARFLVGRFDADGNVKPLLTVDP